MCISSHTQLHFRFFHAWQHKRTNFAPVPSFLRGTASFNVFCDHKTVLAEGLCLLQTIFAFKQTLVSPLPVMLMSTFDVPPLKNHWCRDILHLLCISNMLGSTTLILASPCLCMDSGHSIVLSCIGSPANISARQCLMSLLCCNCFINAVHVPCCILTPGTQSCCCPQPCCNGWPGWPCCK